VSYDFLAYWNVLCHKGDVNDETVNMIKRSIGIILISSLFFATGCSGEAGEEESRLPTEQEVMETYQNMRDSLAQRFAETYKEYESEFSETTLPDIASKPEQTP